LGSKVQDVNGRDPAVTLPQNDRNDGSIAGLEDRVRQLEQYSGRIHAGYGAADPRE
jgi:hypothetical protein